MNSKILVGTEVLEVTHISNKCATPNQLYSAEFPMLSVSELDNGLYLVVVLRTHLSGELVKASDELIPSIILPMILADCVLANSPEGLELQKLGMSKC